MDEIIKQATPKTPYIHLSNTGRMEFKGRSIPENSLDFYNPLNAWLDEYIKNPAENSEVHVQLEYFNTASSKCLLDFFKRLEAITSKVTIHWYYEQDDEDMLEAGEDYEAIINVPFKMIEVEEMA
jgi:hypothetical protein